MFRKACLVALGLALAAIVPSEASVADEIRELHSSNKTKHSHKDTKHTRNKKAREVTLCLGGDLSFTNPPGQEVGNRNYVFNFNSEVFCCDDITTANPEALGQLAYTCSWIERAMGGSTVAVCHGLLDMNTAWHKKDNSVAAFTFMVDTAAFATMSTGQFTPLASAVTGTTGAWGKADNIQGFYLDVVANPYTNDYPFEITIDYKSRGWNPCS